jgi:hypothetical protein
MQSEQRWILPGRAQIAAKAQIRGSQAWRSVHHCANHFFLAFSPACSYLCLLLRKLIEIVGQPERSTPHVHVHW